MRAVPHLCELYPGICLKIEEKVALDYYRSELFSQLKGEKEKESSKFKVNVPPFVKLIYIQL
jgi:hypothetical protein